MGFQELWQLLQEPGVPSLQAAGALGPACQHRLPGATAAAVGTEELSLWAAGILGSACQVLASRSHRTCCNHGRTKPVDSRSPRACLLVWAARSHGSYYRHGGLKPAGSGNPGACLPAQASRNVVQQLLPTGEPSLLACAFC
jgi:hypothetical protein